MERFLKLLHILGLLLWVGSVPNHIALAVLAQPPADTATVAVLTHARSVSAQLLTTPGLFLTVLSGIGLLLKQGLAAENRRWMILKCVLVAAAVLNGFFFLAPVSAELARIAQGAAASQSALPAEYFAALAREGIFAPPNAIIIVIALLLSMLKPRLGAPAPIAPR